MQLLPVGAVPQRKRRLRLRGGLQARRHGHRPPSSTFSGGLSLYHWSPDLWCSSYLLCRFAVLWCFNKQVHGFSRVALPPCLFSSLRPPYRTLCSYPVAIPRKVFNALKTRDQRTNTLTIRSNHSLCLHTSNVLDVACFGEMCGFGGPQASRQPA